MALKITEIFAFIGVDDNGDEGLVAWHDPKHGWMPLVGADKARLDAYRQMAEHIAFHTLQPVREVHFTSIQDLGTVTPVDHDFRITDITPDLRGVEDS